MNLPFFLYSLEVMCMELDSRLVRLAKELSIPLRKVEEKFKRELEKKRKRYPLRPESEILERAIISTKNYFMGLEKRLGRNMKWYRGFIIKVGERYNLAERIARRHLNEYSRNPEEAVLTKKVEIVDGEVVPILEKNGSKIDLRKAKWYQTDLVLLTHREGEEDWKYTVLESRGNPVNVKYFTYCRFRAREMGESERMRRLRAGTLTEFIPVEEKIDVLSILEGVFPRVEFRDIVEGKVDGDRIVLVEGDVLVIRTGVTSSGRRMIVITDPSLETFSEIPVLLPITHPIDFVEDSRVYVIGRVFKSKSSDDWMIDAISVYCPEGLKEVERDEDEEEDPVGEESVLRWVSTQ